MRVRLRDPDLPHQIVIKFMPANTNLIFVSCNCMRKNQGHGGYEPIEARKKWEHPEAMAVWRKHLEES